MWLVPTCSRPKNAGELLKQLTVLDASQGIVFVNGKEHAEEYSKIILPEGWQLYPYQQNIGAIGALNWMFKEYPNEKFYGFIGDDEYVYSKNWNTMLTETAGDWHIAHANDGWQSKNRIHSFVCIGGELARAVGYLAVERCWHWFGFDNMWETIAKIIPIRKFVEDIETEHRHYLAHKIAKDDCYALGESKMEEDRKAFSNWLESELPEVIERIKKLRSC